jgi:hypothetical protein
MFRLVKMSDAWYAMKIEDVDSDLEAISLFVESGDIVALTDDMDYFADEMGIDIKDIQVVDL